MTAMTTSVMIVTMMMLLSPAECWSEIRGAPPVTYDFTPGGAGVWSMMSRTAVTESLASVSPMLPRR